MLRFTGVLTAPCIVTAPSRARVYILDNQTTGAFDVTFKTSSGAGVTLPQGTRALYYSDSTEVYVVAGAGAGGSGLVVASASGTWNWDTATSGAPASGRLAINTAGVTAATELRAHIVGSDGVDRETLYRSLASQDELYLQDQTTSANTVRYRLTAAGSDQGVWWSFPVVWVANSGVAFALNQPITVVFSLSTSLPRATTTQAGITVLADNALAIAGLDDTTAITPVSLQAKWATLPPLPVQATTSVAGIAPLATTTEGATGTDNTKIMTPLTVQAKINAIPLATESVVGLSERATTQESIDGVDTTRFVTPAALQAKINTLPGAPLSGTPLSLARYAASGTALETAPGVLTSSSGTLSVGAAAAPTDVMLTVQSAVNLATTKLLAMTTSTSNLGTAQTLLRRSSGDMIDHFGVGLNFAIEDTAAVENLLGQVGMKRQGADNSGRLMIRTANAGTLPAATGPGALAVDPVGNVSVNSDLLASGGANLLGLGPATAPTSSVADTVLLYAADRGATAGKGSLHVRTEDGTSHVLGDLSGIGTTLTATLGSGASYRTLTVNGSLLTVGQSSVQERAQALIASSFVVSTDATRTARVTLSVYDATAAREGVRIETSGTAPMLGFFGQPAVVRQTLAAAATDATTTQALANSLRTALINLGLGA